MSQQLINHSPDLLHLQHDGLEVEVKQATILVNNVPYVNQQKEICFGTLICELSLSGDKAIRPINHVINFIGDHPCNKDGTLITAISHQSVKRNWGANLNSSYAFSNKPEKHRSLGFPDYYEKFTHYISIISAPAKSLDSGVTEKTFKVIESVEKSSVFHYFDTNSSRAGINNISQKLEKQRIAIVGLGGTGSYLLDLVAKTPTLEIHLFDGDTFDQHNAFRAPSAPSSDELKLRPFKVDYFNNLYSNMHKGIISHREFINSSNVNELKEFDFVFVCVDKGDVKGLIFDVLESNDISFIDVGIGVQIVNDALVGMVRTTTSTPKMRAHVKSRVSLADDDDDEYSSNIQIAELNSLNAANAVIKWKKHLGFYHDHVLENNSVYTINANMLTDEDHDAA